jgi:RNA polymerase sigma-70 factor (sigma-E family)
MFGDRRRHAEFTAFAETAQQRLFRQAYLLAGSREAAQDLVQTTLTKMYVAWPRIDNPSAYAYRTLMRAFLEVRRRADRERRLHDLPGGAPPEHDPAHVLTVRAALAELPPRMRAVVVLRYWEDLSVEQTAAALGCTTGTVKSTASRGLAHLRELLGEAFDDRIPSTPQPKEKP